MATEYLFKATNGYKATHGGKYTYRRNRWTRHIDNPVPCESETRVLDTLAGYDEVAVHVKRNWYY